MSSSKKGQIESAKIVIGEVFSRFWFRIPDYQRAYVWGKDEISELIDDVNYASEHNPEGQYFLGSMVLRKATRTTDGVSFEEYELLDGQQRLTTLMLMLACIRDRVTDDKLKAACREMLFQEENKWKKIPGRNRIVYDIRDNVGTFIESYIKTDGGSHSPDLVGIAASKNLSLSNMAAGLQTIHASIDDTTRFPSEADFDRFVGYLLNNALFIYQAAEILPHLRPASPGPGAVFSPSFRILKFSTPSGRFFAFPGPSPASFSLTPAPADGFAPSCAVA